MTRRLRRFFRPVPFAGSMPAEPAEEPAPALPSSTYPEAKSAGEWAIGIAFVLAALALVAWIGWTIWTM